jgi:Lrp/AsnC family transcriptional regulator, leucine-responsive regulatory protein
MAREKRKLTPTDRNILSLLQDAQFLTPRLTKIAHKLHLPTSTVQARIRKLEEGGAISGYTAVLNPVEVDKSYAAFVFGQAKLGPNADMERPAKLLAKIPQVQEVFFVTGDYDYLVKLRVRDQDEYMVVIQKVAECFEVRGKGIIAPKCFKETLHLSLD